MRGQLITTTAVYRLNDVVNVETNDEFFESFNKLMEKVNTAHEVILCENLNCKPGKGETDNAIGNKKKKP